VTAISKQRVGVKAPVELPQYAIETCVREGSRLTIYVPRFGLAMGDCRRLSPDKRKVLDTLPHSLDAGKTLAPRTFEVPDLLNPRTPRRAIWACTKTFRKDEILLLGESSMTDTLEPRNSRSAKKPVRSEDKLLLSRQEAAELLSISQRALDYLIANKMLSIRRIGSRVLVPLQDLRRFARADHPQRLAG